MTSFGLTFLSWSSPKPSLSSTLGRKFCRIANQARACRMLEIDRQRAHAEIALDKTRRGIDIFVLAVMAKSIEPAFLRFDLDDLSTVIGEQSAGVRTRVAGRKSENANALEDVVGAMHG